MAKIPKAIDVLHAFLNKIDLDTTPLTEAEFNGVCNALKLAAIYEHSGWYKVTDPNSFDFCETIDEAFAALYGKDENG